MNKALHLTQKAFIISTYNTKSEGGEKKVNEIMTDKQLRYINRLIIFVRKLLKLVPQDKREELESEFDSILLEVTQPDEK